MLPPLSDLSPWERWALQTWLSQMDDQTPARMPWHNLPPYRYTRALGELAVNMGIRLPRRLRLPHERPVPRRKDVRVTSRWGSRKEFNDREVGNASAGKDGAP